MAKIKANAAIDFSPPDRRRSLLLLDFPFGWHHISRPPVKGSLGFSRRSSAFPPSERRSYTRLKFAETTPNTVVNRDLRSPSNFSVRAMRSVRRFRRTTESSVMRPRRSSASSYCSMAIMFTSPRLAIRRSMFRTLDSASPTLGKSTSSDRGSMFCEAMS